MLFLGVLLLERPGLILMLGSLVNFLSLFAQAAPAAKGAGTDPYVQLLPYLAFIPIIYFMMIRPNQIQDRKRRELINALKKNDKVLTAAGMYGTVISVDEKEPGRPPGRRRRPGQDTVHACEHRHRRRGFSREAGRQVGRGELNRSQPDHDRGDDGGEPGSPEGRDDLRSLGTSTPPRGPGPPPY